MKVKDGDRQRGRGNRLEQWVKGVGFRPVCWHCDIPMDKVESYDMYSLHYVCPNCKQKWVDEWIH